MQTVTTLPILQTVSDATTHYVGLQPAIRGSTTAEYVNRNLSFNPSSNTLNIAVNVNFLPNAISGSAIAESSLSSSKINFLSNTINGSAIAESSLSSSKFSSLSRVLENAFIIPVAASGNVVIYVGDSSVYYYTSNTTGNVTFDLRVSPTVLYDSLVSIGQSLTTAFVLTQGNIQYIANVAIDGVYQTSNTRWGGNTRPTYSGTLTNQLLDVYTFTTLKIGANSYSILGSRTSYGVG